jgi:DHA2 family multidrug resistance protein
MLYGVIFVLPIFMGRVLHFNATQTGVMFIPGALLTALIMPFVGKMLGKVDARFLILTGIIAIESMLIMLTQFSSFSTEKELFWSLIVRGIGMAFLFVPINATVLGQFRGPSLGQVAGLMNLIRQLGGSVGIALIGFLLDRNSHRNHLELSSHVSVLNPATQVELGRMGVMDLGHISEKVLRYVDLRTDQQVFLMSFSQMMWYIFFIFSFSFIPLFYLRTQKAANPKAALDAH